MGKSLVGMVAVMALLCLPEAHGGYREQQKVTDAEIVRLPKFCWAQMEVPGAVGAEFTPQNCGPGTNHYCPGLVDLLRAKSPLTKSKSDRIRFLRSVENSIAYTEKWTKDQPYCSITPHVQATKAEVARLLVIYGGRPLAPK